MSCVVVVVGRGVACLAAGSACVVCRLAAGSPLVAAGSAWGVGSYTGLPHPGPFTGFTRAVAFYQPPAKCQMVFFTRDLFFTRSRRFTRGRKACGPYTRDELRFLPASRFLPALPLFTSPLPVSVFYHSPPDLPDYQVYHLPWPTPYTRFLVYEPTPLGLLAPGVSGLWTSRSQQPRQPAGSGAVVSPQVCCSVIRAGAASPLAPWLWLCLCPLPLLPSYSARRLSISTH
jgi:hypothetical protein